MPLLRRWLDETITELVNRGVTRFLNGAAIGFDTIAAFMVLSQRETDPRIKLVIVQPCRNQDAKWCDEDKQAYKRLLNTADEVICLSERYYDGCMAVRNQYLVEHSDICVAYMKRERSGAGQTTRLARARGLEVINLAE